MEMELQLDQLADVILTMSGTQQKQEEAAFVITQRLIQLDQTVSFVLQTQIQMV
jgi:hypothetical protein